MRLPRTYVSKFTQLKFDGLKRARVDQSFLPVLSRSVTVKPSPKAEVGRSADCSRAPVTCGAGLGLWLSGEAAAEPAAPSESAVVVMAITPPHGAMTIAEAAPSAS
jgi:hypothetical protein